MTQRARSAEPTPQTAAPPTKAARVWRRTRVGGALAAALAGLLALAYGRFGEEVVLGVGCALMALGTYELARMGRLARRERALALGVAAAGQLPAVWGALGAGAIEPLAVGLELARPALLAAAAWGLLALVPARAQLGAAASLALFAGASALAPPALFWSVAGLFAVFAAGKALDERARRAELRLTIGMAAWVVFPLPALAWVLRGYGGDGLVALLVLSKIGDVFGYYVGNAIGRTHPFPRVSPGKTTAGCVASLVSAVACGGAMVPAGLLPAAPLGVLGGLLAGALVNLAAQAGDLLESRAKRRAEVKDSGTWFGPSGGVLDLVDSLLLSVPAALLVWPLLFGHP